MTDGGYKRRDGTGVLFQVLLPSLLISTDASQTGWDAHLQVVTVVGRWSFQERELYINVSEMNVCNWH